MDSVRTKRAKNHGQGRRQAITVKEKRATRVQIDQAQLPNNYLRRSVKVMIKRITQEMDRFFDQFGKKCPIGEMVINLI
jgi:hypothetical protein